MVGVNAKQAAALVTIQPGISASETKQTSILDQLSTLQAEQGKRLLAQDEKLKPVVALLGRLVEQLDAKKAPVDENKAEELRNEAATAELAAAKQAAALVTIQTGISASETKQTSILDQLSTLQAEQEPVVALLGRLVEQLEAKKAPVDEDKAEELRKEAATAELAAGEKADVEAAAIIALQEHKNFAPALVNATCPWIFPGGCPALSAEQVHKTALTLRAIQTGSSTALSRIFGGML
jgi:hypothetical protein